TAQFTINATAPAASANVSITAAYGTNSQSATLTVLPAGALLTSLTVAPSSVEGGASATGVATLGAPAPAGGAIVALSLSNTANASVPATVLVPEGTTSASFTVTTRQVA